MNDVELQLKNVFTSGSVTAYLLQKPETAVYPCVVYQCISTNPFNNTLTGKADMFTYRYQFSTVGSDYASVKALAGKVRNILDHNVTDFNFSYLAGEYNSFDENGIYQIIQDFYLIY